METLIRRLIGYLPANLASLLGIIQVLIKFGKEVCTLMVNMLFPIFPNAIFHKTVGIIRGIFNKADDFLELGKAWLLKFTIKKTE